METLVSLPLVLPPTVVGYYLLLVLGRGSPIVEWFGWRILFTWGAAAIASAVMGFPLFVLSARAAIAGVDPALEHAADVGLVGTRSDAAHHPAAGATRHPGRPGAGATRALGEFGVTLMVAGSIPGRTQTLPLALYDAVQNRQYDQANAMVLLLTCLGFCEPLGGATLRATPAEFRSVCNQPAGAAMTRAGSADLAADVVSRRRFCAAAADFRLPCGWRSAPRSWCCSAHRDRARPQR